MPGLDEFGLDDDDDVDSLMLQHGLAGPAADGAAHMEQQLQRFSLEYARLRSEVVSAMSREKGTRGVFSPAEQALADLEAALQRIESLVGDRGPGDPWKLNLTTWRSDCESLQRDIASRRAEREPLSRPTVRPLPVVRASIIPTPKKSVLQKDPLDLESPSREESSNEVDHLLSSMRRPEPEEEHVQAPLTSLKLAAWDATFGIFMSPTAARNGEQKRPVKTIVVVCIVAALALAGVLTSWREDFVDVIEDVPISQGLPHRQDVVDVVEDVPLGEVLTRGRSEDVDFPEVVLPGGEDDDEG